MYVWRRHGSSYAVWKLFEIVAPGGVYYAIYGPVYIRSVFSTIPDSSSNPDFFLDFIIFSTEFLLFSLCKAICFLLFRGNTMVWQQFTNFWVEKLWFSILVHFNGTRLTNVTLWLLYSKISFEAHQYMIWFRVPRK